MREIVVVGAGNIGRGLLGETAAREGWHVTFVEAVHAHAARLREAGRYRVHLSGAASETTTVTGYRVVDPADESAVAAVVERAVGSGGFAAVAVGPQNLGAAAASLAPAITRVAAGPVPILVCENKRTASAELADALVAAGVPPDAFVTIATSVERMVRPDPGSLDLYAEAGQTLFVDRNAWERATRGTGPVDTGMSDAAPAPAGFRLVDDLDAYYARKLYTNNAGHALLAYLGHRRGHRTIADAAGDPELAAPLRELLTAASGMLALDYGLDPGELERHTKELIEIRFPNADLADPIARVARDPIRKLGPDDRLVGLLRRLDRHGFPTGAVLRTIAAALGYRDDADRESVELATRVETDGSSRLLESICGIGPADPNHHTIVTYYKEEFHG
ncbi:MAG: hypothetical protein EA382_10610 [Spirochaetaceae bacterium]|nr:MAG: hypothetical protein EA382_10610 [Spirochaetaceae bacterium]